MSPQPVFVLHGRAGARRYALINTGRDGLLHLVEDQPGESTSSATANPTSVPELRPTTAEQKYPPEPFPSFQTGPTVQLGDLYLDPQGRPYDGLPVKLSVLKVGTLR